MCSDGQSALHDLWAITDLIARQLPSVPELVIIVYADLLTNCEVKVFNYSNLRFAIILVWS